MCKVSERALTPLSVLFPSKLLRKSESCTFYLKFNEHDVHTVKVMSQKLLVSFDVY